MFACGCGLLIFRCIALHPLVLGLQICCLFPCNLLHGLGCLDIRLNIQFFLFNMRFSRYVSDWHFYQSFANSINSNSQITGKNQLYGTALPCWRRLTHSFRSCEPHRPRLYLSPLEYVCSIWNTHQSAFSFEGIRQPPALPCRLQHSTIGRLGLNHRVRDGYGCGP